MNLFVKSLQILTPFQMTIIKLEDGEADLIKLFERSYINLAGGIWSKFVPKKNQSFSFGTASIWTDAHRETADSIVEGINSFVDSVQVAGADKVKALLDASSEISEKLDASYAGCEKVVNHGLDEQFAAVRLCATTLGLNPICVRFFAERFEQCVWAFARIDKDISDAEKRYAEYLIARIHQITDEYAKSVAAAV
jgi:hypothetical protein